MDKKFKKTIGKTNLVKLVLVFCGTQLKYIEKAGHFGTERVH